MKKALFLSVVLLLSVSCNAPESNSSPNSESQISSTDSATNNETESQTNHSETIDERSNLIIKYYYEDGTFLSKDTKTVSPGESYSFPVNIEIPFMSPNMTTIEGIKENKEESVSVFFSYNKKVIENPKVNTHYSSFMGNPNYGISFTFYAKALKTNQTLFKGTDFEITSSYISDNSNTLYYSESYIENQYDSRLSLADNEEAIYTFSFFSDKAVIYKNTHRIFSIFNNRTSGNEYPIYNSVYKNILYSVEEDGFSLGNKEIHDLIVSEGIGQTEVVKRANEYIITELQYVDENENIIELHSKAAKEPYSYSFSVSDLPNYKIDDTSILSGYAETSKTIKAKQIFTGSDHTLTVNKIDSGNQLGWSDEAKWLKYANDFTGDFTMKLTVLNYGAISFDSKPESGYDICWRTILPIVYDSNTKDRWVTRLDWFGWMDDINGDGKNIGTSANYNNSDSYVFDYNTDLYPIYKEMEIDMTYSRRGDTLYLDSVIKPKRTPYLGQQYQYHCALYGVQSDSLSFALSAEDSIGIITSLQY